MNTVVKLRASQSEKPTVRGGRAKNTDYRQREYLTEGEIDSLLAAAGNSRGGNFYANLYLAMFEEARGKNDAAKTYARRAAELAPQDYMGDVARIHAKYAPAVAAR